jgi:hypothetical protein
MVAITDSLTSLKISAGVEELQSTCDHCLVRAVHAQGDAKFLTTPNDKVAFMICGGCKAMYYCSRVSSIIHWPRASCYSKN